MADKKKKKKKKKAPAGPPMPQPRSLKDELGELAPMLGGMSREAAALQVASQKEMTQFQYDFFKQHYQELVNEQIEAQSRATLRSRNDALNYVSTQGANARAAARQANPEWAQASDKLSAMVGQIGQRSDLHRELQATALGQLRSGGPTTPFTEELDRQVLDELKLGGALTPEEERAAQQSARTAFAARGQALGGSSAVAEVLERDSMARGRLRERQAMAGGREAAGLQRLQYGQGFAANMEAAEQAQLQAERGFGLGATALTESQAPIWKIMGMQGATTNPEQLLGFTSSVQGFNPTGMYSQGLSYGADVFNTNLNMQASMYNSFQNNQAALEAAKIQSAAQIKSAQTQASAAGSGGSGIGGAVVGAAGSAVAGAAAAVGLCWVARAVFGGADKRWRIFKVWLLIEAPRELRELYRAHGEGIASVIEKLPLFKAALRAIMEPIVA